MITYKILQSQDNSINASSFRLVIEYTDFWGNKKHMYVTLTAKEKGLNATEAIADILDNTEEWRKNSKGTGHYYILKAQRGIAWFHPVRHDYRIPENKAAKKRAEKLNK